MDKGDVLRWFRTLSDKDFVDFFYEASSGRPLDRDLPENCYVICESSFSGESSQHETVFLARPRDKSLRWAEDSPICQYGECSTCKAPLMSWAKEVICPVCGNEAYCT